ncbi:UDP-glucuronic acid decarboxylase family protein [Pseudobacteriovorax antillogorgiicola]|uniref:UDP-glucuronate decarboxylase n=1 Tax=Pseudobacteriovorax antillogorgiicola TaxID=1513793 RepID=A0A1Y6CHM1_9BACT|nr:UDP-glucuronic acid decarboxylase family protein [Pseudobacteriovorax antillogorgiicola]TCS46625.1 UDP-glucuronate decarboxylase [Pseudobacteriovorax antillogorgiicola]SMF66008.1 UDP-glucuronate decarboxylase [Pseudobacteriovorax antillogorgiicola]
MQAIGQKRVLITGGAGFLGSHLCDRYIEDGWDVICMDNFHTGSKNNIQHLRDHPRFELVRHDITEPFMAEVDLILNFACPASPVHYQSNPIKTLKTSLLGTMNMLGLAKRVGARITHASTSEVYGDPQVHPQPESYWGNVNPIGPRSCYDEGKRAAETLCFDYHRVHDVESRVVRIFNTYGPRMAVNDGRVVSNFIVQALRGDDITIYGDGSQTRSFCFASDLIDGIIALTHQSDTQGPINIGNDGEFTVKELAEKVVSITRSSSKIVYKPLPEDDPKVRRPNLEQARKFLGYEPKVRLEEGLIKTVDYFKSELAL